MNKDISDDATNCYTDTRLTFNSLLIEKPSFKCCNLTVLRGLK